MFWLSNVRFEVCTQALAKQISEMPGLPGERPIKASRIAYLDNLRRTGRFTAPSWAILIDTVTGLSYRANGQHSSTMLAQVPPAEFPTDLRCTISEYSTDNFAVDAYEVFEIFDNPRQSRTNTDKMGTFRAQFPELQPIKLEVLVAVANGISHYEDAREGGVVRTPRQRGMYFADSAVRAFVVWAAPYDEERHGWMLYKPGVVAEMYNDLHVDPDVARRFWDLTFTESHPDPDHESRELSRSLMDLASRPRIAKDKLQKEAAKYWKRYRRSQSPPAAAA